MRLRKRNGLNPNLKKIIRSFLTLLSIKKSGKTSLATSTPSILSWVVGEEALLPSWQKEIQRLTILRLIFIRNF